MDLVGNKTSVERMLALLIRSQLGDVRRQRKSQEFGLKHIISLICEKLNLPLPCKSCIEDKSIIADSENIDSMKKARPSFMLESHWERLPHFKN